MVIANAPDSVRERILEAAAEEFGRAGFSGAKVDAIARRAGVNKAGLYYHVGNKEKLYEAVMLRLFGQVAGAVEQAAAPGLLRELPWPPWPRPWPAFLPGCPCCRASWLWRWLRAEPTCRQRP